MGKYLVALCRRTVHAAVLGTVAAVLVGNCVFAQSVADKYPEKPIKIIVNRSSSKRGPAPPR